MATARASGAPQLHRSVMSEPRVHTMPRANDLQFSDDQFLFNLIGGREEDKPNNYYNWKPSSTFAEPAGASAAVGRNKKSKNRNKQQNLSGQQDTPGSTEGNGPARRRTPSTYPRTKYVGSAVERVDLENLRHQLTYSDTDERSTDSQVLGAVSSVNRVNNVKTSDGVVPTEGGSKRPPSGLDTIFVNEMPDRNKIVARLMQIRDYLKQANAMMSTLQNSTESEARDDQVNKLLRLQDHLQEQERGYLALLERMLAEEVGMSMTGSLGVLGSTTSADVNSAEAAVNGRSSQNSGESFATSIAESASLNVDARSDISEATTGLQNKSIGDQAAALEGLKQQHDLLKKMLRQQEELRTLQNRQAALMTLQSQIESRLQQSEQEGADETLSVSTQATTTTTTTTTATSMTEDNMPVTTTIVAGQRSGVPMTSSDLLERRRTLMRMLAEQRDSRIEELQQARSLDWMDQTEVSPPLISAEHQELKDKLEALQQKKQQMDELLAQLHALHPNVPNIVGETSSVASTSSNMNENTAVMVNGLGDEISDDPEATLTYGSDSIRKLHEVRERLTELRDLVQQYQDTSQLLNTGLADAKNQQQQQQLNTSSNYEDPDLMSNLRRLQRGEQVGRLAQMRADQLNSGGDGAHVQVGSGQTTSTVTESETETETESNHSSILAAWGDDPEIREKVRKLKEAKQKLRQLQSLVAMVQQTPEVATVLPDDLAELAAGLTADFSEQGDQDDEDKEEEEDEEEEEEEEDDEEEEDTMEESETGGVGERARGQSREQVPSSLSEGEIPPAFARETKEAYYEAKMNQQRRELQNLMAERQRLLSVQQQLKELNANLPPVRRTLKPSNKSVNVPPPPSRSVLFNTRAVTTPSRDEVYAEMRRNKMLQEELRQKKQELSELLSIVRRNRDRQQDGSEGGTYSVQSDLLEYDNDLFRELLLDAGRVSMRSADITAAATWGGSTQDSEDEGMDDGYPSDGIVQVEEEEEQEQSTVTSDTYTIESGAKLQQGRSQRQYPGRRVTLDDDGETSSLNAARHGIRYPKSSISPRDRTTHARQENIRSAEELVSDAYEPTGHEADIRSLQGHIHQLQRQLSNSVSMCQSLLSEQHSMSNLLSSSLNAGFGSLRPTTPSSGMPPNPYSTANPQMDGLLHNYNLRLQHQQLMLNLNQTYNQLYSQQEEIQRLTQQLGTAGEEGGASYEGPNANANNSTPYLRNTFSPWNPGMSYPGAPPLFGRSPSSGQDMMNPYSSGPFHSGMSFDMTPTFPPGFSQLNRDYPTAYPNPYENSPGDSGAREKDNYTLYARQPTQQQRYLATGEPPANYHVPPNTAQASNDDDEFEAAYLNRAATSGKHSKMASAYTLDSGIGDVNELAARESVEVLEERRVPPLDIRSLLMRTERQRRQREELGSQRSNTSSKRGAGASSGKHPMPSSTSQAKAQLASHSKPSARLAKLVGPQPGRGLSSSISGTAFLDTASMTSTVSMSSLPGDMSDRPYGRGQAKGQEQQQQDTDRSMKSQTSELESDAGSEFSLFEALRESIYSEVATLISQNESRPHFLIELFRELQMLNSDYLRQRALYALQDLVSKYLTDDALRTPEVSVEAARRALPAWMQTAGSEQTPSESFITSDEEEIKARLYGVNLQNLRDLSKEVLVGDDQYDYIENVDSASTLSTPPSTGPGEFGFANEDLGDTVIHLDKALKRMREYERMKAEVEASGTSSLDNAKDRGTISASDMTSNSSAQDVGSESSFSDLPYPRIDTRQLDLQIKGIMQEVIPYLKEHMDDVCSPQLLAYIRRLVLGLARQRDESREFVRFFNRQLGSILEDSLAKFSGRKMRECGEDLLVDISEILFNELAFFRLMQDLDTAGNKLKNQAAKEEGNDDDDDEEDDDEEEEEEEEGEGNTETGTETGTAQEEVTGEGESSSEESSSDEEDTVHQAGPREAQGGAGKGQMEDALEKAMAVASKYEEEELGNARDDALATQVEISDRDEDSEPQGIDHLQIELSMSESKGVTYIGSGEEEDDPDNLGEAVEETITSIGAAIADGEADSMDDTTISTEIRLDTEQDSSQKEDVSKEEEASKEDNSDLDVTPTSQAVTNDQGAKSGENNNEEITIDDLPQKLTVLSQTTLDSQMANEQSANDGVQAVLETMATGDAELAGDPSALRVPDGAPMQNGVIAVNAGDIGSE